MQTYRTVSGGNCRMVLYRESAPGVVDTSKDGVIVDFYTEGFATNANKASTSVITGTRGPGKPVDGTPDYPGSMEVAPYAPLMGHILRALCGAPTTTSVAAVSLDGAVTDEGKGFVGLPLASGATQTFVQDDMLTIVGTTNYNGVYRCEYGTGSAKVVVKHAYTAESLDDATAAAHRGCGAFLKGAAVDKTGGKVGLPVDGLGVSLNVGESVTVSGTTGYDATYTLQAGTTRKLLVVSATYTAETFDGAPTALPAFYAHHFALPKHQPTVCVEKYLDYDSGAATYPYEIYYSNKLNGLSFNAGGQTETKISLDFSVGYCEPSTGAVSQNTPVSLPAVPWYDKEWSVWLDDDRLGDVETANVSQQFNIEAKTALGDMHKRSRQPEGDPNCSCDMTVFVEEDRYSLLANAAASVKFGISCSGAGGERLWITYPESELDTSGVTISGKGGLSQSVKALAYIDHGTSICEYDLINRVASYA